MMSLLIRLITLGKWEKSGFSGRSNLTESCPSNSGSSPPMSSDKMVKNQVMAGGLVQVNRRHRNWKRQRHERISLGA